MWTLDFLTALAEGQAQHQSQAQHIKVKTS